MAYYGLSKPVIAKRTANPAGDTYSDGFLCGKAVGTSVTPNYSEASLYGDNELAEYAKEFSDADVSANVTTLPIEAVTTMFGHTYDESTKMVTYAAADKANAVGYGFYATESVNGVASYVACWLPNVKFTEAAESYSTKGSSIEFQTPTIEGKASADSKGAWKYKQTFTTEDAAIEWLKTKAGITE